MIDPAHIAKLKNMPEWKALETHIHDCIAALDSCSLIPEDADHDKASRGRKYAVEIMQHILEPFLHDPLPEVDKRKEALQKLGML